VAPGPALARLLGLASPALAPPLPPPAALPGDLPAGAAPGLRAELAALLAARNGFMAFEGALVVLPAGPAGAHPDLASLNAGAWRAEYWHGCAGLLVFAANAFGDLYTLAADGVLRLDPETGETAPMGADLEAWAATLLGDWQAETGHAAARAWQELYGAIPDGCRLMTVRPFVLGGTDAVDNLKPVPLAEGLALRGRIATRIRDLPDGATLSLEPGP
jgi:hypothetical protein